MWLCFYGWHRDFILNCHFISDLHCLVLLFSQQVVIAEALLNIRRGHRGFVTKLINSATSLLENFDEHDRFKLMGTKTSLSDKLQILETLNEQIFSTLKEEGEITREIYKAIDIKFSINECIFAINSVLNKNDTTKISTSPNLDPSPSNVNLSNGKLPSLSIKTFYGTLLEFSSFWDSFRAAIHENDSLKNITKFKYLISHLKGPAKAAISGILITESNYLESVELLQKRVGNKQILINPNID